MRDVTDELEVAPLLARFDEIGGVLDYVFLEAPPQTEPARLHRQAALRGMEVIHQRSKQWALSHATRDMPIEMFFRIHWDEANLSGGTVNLATFWGTDDVEMKRIGERAWSVPNVDGYKTAFFHPPHGVQAHAAEAADLFAAINRHALGPDPERAEIYSWSTDWSNYFDAGHEWWGAFYWTVRPAGTPLVVVIAASSTD